jgi:hypothetical protein
MKSNLLTAFLAILTSITLFSCQKKDAQPTTTGTGTVKLEFLNNVGSSSLKMDGTYYTNAHGDSFKVTRFNYYISNIKLIGSGSAQYTEAESYHLIQQIEPLSTAFNITEVPTGAYTGVTFMIGVDSARNVAGAQTGDLDPTEGMFWDWNTGYIMLKFEGSSPQSSQAGKLLQFHVGGFSGVNSAVRTVTLNFPNPITVNTTNVNHIHLAADVLALFKSPNVVDFSAISLMQDPGTNAKMFADNYANMFSVSYSGL